MTTVAAAQSGFELTPKGLAYALAHGRDAIERRIDRHLALVTALLAILDAQDGDTDLEPTLGWASIEAAFGEHGPTHLDDHEFVNEDGGNILDEPHDWLEEDGE